MSRAAIARKCISAPELSLQVASFRFGSHFQFLIRTARRRRSLHPIAPIAELQFQLPPINPSIQLRPQYLLPTQLRVATANANCLLGGSHYPNSTWTWELR